ncbi:hypothetical protein BT63DRAFT_423777, partial [Microthyrium microscopicum]
MESMGDPGSNTSDSANCFVYDTQAREQSVDEDYEEAMAIMRRRHSRSDSEDGIRLIFNDNPLRNAKDAEIVHAIAIDNQNLHADLDNSINQLQTEYTTRDPPVDQLIALQSDLRSPSPQFTALISDDSSMRTSQNLDSARNVTGSGISNAPTRATPPEEASWQKFVFLSSSPHRSPFRSSEKHLAASMHAQASSVDDEDASESRWTTSAKDPANTSKAASLASSPQTGALATGTAQNGPSRPSRDRDNNTHASDRSSRPKDPDLGLHTHRWPLPKTANTANAPWRTMASSMMASRGASSSLPSHAMSKAATVDPRRHVHVHDSYTAEQRTHIQSASRLARGVHDPIALGSGTNTLHRSSNGATGVFKRPAPFVGSSSSQMAAGTWGEDATGAAFDGEMATTYLMTVRMMMRLRTKICMM